MSSPSGAEGAFGLLFIGLVLWAATIGIVTIAALGIRAARDPKQPGSTTAIVVSAAMIAFGSLCTLVSIGMVATMSKSDPAWLAAFVLVPCAGLLVAPSVWLLQAIRARARAPAGPG